MTEDVTGTMRTASLAPRGMAHRAATSTNATSPTPEISIGPRRDRRLIPQRGLRNAGESKSDNEKNGSGRVYGTGRRDAEPWKDRPRARLCLHHPPRTTVARRPATRAARPVVPLVPLHRRQLRHCRLFPGHRVSITPAPDLLPLATSPHSRQLPIPADVLRTLDQAGVQHRDRPLLAAH